METVYCVIILLPAPVSSLSCPPARIHQDPVDPPSFLSPQQVFSGGFCPMVILKQWQICCQAVSGQLGLTPGHEPRCALCLPRTTASCKPCIGYSWQWLFSLPVTAGGALVQPLFSGDGPGCTWSCLDLVTLQKRNSQLPWQVLSPICQLL